MTSPSSLTHQIRNLIKDSSLYGLSDALSKGVMFLAMPILTRLLTPNKFGLLDLLFLIVSFATKFMMLGFDHATQSFYLDSKLYPKPDDRKRLVSSLFWFLALWGSAMLVLGVGLAPVIDRYLFAGRLGSALVALALLFTFVQLFYWFGRDILRLQFRAISYSTVSFLTVVFNLAVGIGVLVLTDRSLKAYYVSNIVVYAVFGLVGIFLIRQEIGKIFDVREVAQAVKFGLPFVPSNLIFLLMILMDRFILNRFVSLDQIGLYALAAKVVAALHIPLNILGVAWNPLAIKSYYDDKVDHQKLYREMLNYIVAGFGFLALLLTVFAKEIISLMAPSSYAGAVAVVAPLSLSIVMSAAGFVTMLAPLLVRRPIWNLVITSSSAVLNLILCFVLIPRWGIAGAGWAIAGAYAFFGLMGWVVMERLMAPFRFDRVKSLALMGFVFLSVWLGSHVDGLSGVAPLFAKVGLPVLFLLGLVGLRVLTPQVIRAAWQWGHEILTKKS